MPKLDAKVNDLLVRVELDRINALAEYQARAWAEIQRRRLEQVRKAVEASAKPQG